MNVPGWLMTVAVLMSLSIGRALAGETATAVATITAGFVSGIPVTSGGSGYTSEPSVTLTGGGGSGAAAKAILSGNKVALILVLTSGSGYLSAPTVVVEAPPRAVGVRLRMVPELTVVGPVGSLARVEWAKELSGPFSGWSTWSNIVIGVEGTVLVDLTPTARTRYYRAVAGVNPVGPAGFVWIPPGTFTMGSPTTEADRYIDEVQHMVTLTQGFWLSDHEVTQGEFEAVLGSNLSWHKGDSNRPVEKVTWESAVIYCQKLTERDRAAGRITTQQSYRLPTEAEWEYAARAGTTDSRYGSLDEIGWHLGNSGLGSHAVKQKSPNAWGLYDMIGNVWEWCSDHWADYPIGSAIDPSGPSTGTSHVFRGGSWGNDARFSRSASRWGSDSCVLCLRNDLGFRPAFGQIR